MTSDLVETLLGQIGSCQAALEELREAVQKQRGNPLGQPLAAETSKVLGGVLNSLAKLLHKAGA